MFRGLKNLARPPGASWDDVRCTDWGLVKQRGTDEIGIQIVE